MCSIVCQEDSATLLLLQMKHCKIKSMFFFSPHNSSSVSSWLLKMTSARGEKRRAWWECPGSQVRKLSNYTGLTSELVCNTKGLVGELTSNYEQH